MHIFTQMLCPEYKAPCWYSYFTRLCGCFGRGGWRLSGLESCSSDKHSQPPLILWPQTHEDAVAHMSCHTVLTNRKKKGDPHVGGEITLDSQTFIRLWMLKSPPRKREMKKKYEMRVRERRGAMRESAESRNHVTWCLLAKVAYIAETVN